jgi:hypothetical protein
MSFPSAGPSEVIVPSTGPSPGTAVLSAGRATPVASSGGWKEVLGSWESTMEVLGARYSAPMVASFSYETLPSHSSSMVRGESQILR